MKKYLSIYLLSLTAILAISCASRTVRDEGDLVSSLYKEKKYQEVIDKITKEELYQREEDEFLKEAELGMAYFNLRNFDKALFHLNAAKIIANRLYKVSISNKVESLFIGEATDIYYPNEYEQASIRFYEIMAHYMKVEEATTDKDKRFHMQAMVSTLRDWSAYLENFKAQNRGRAIYKGTTFIDLMGAVVHDTYNRAKDRSVVNSFKKLGRKDLVQQMGIYPSFNKEYEQYGDKYSKLHLLPKSEVDKLISKTQTYQQVDDFFVDKKKYNTYVIILDGHVVKKTANVYEFPLNLPVSVIITNNDGMDDFVTFSLKMLAITRGTKPKIYFELPKIDSPIAEVPIEYELKDSGNKVVSKDRVILMANTSEVMSQSLKSDIDALEAKVGARLAAKHIALLYSSYATYKNLYQSGPFLAYLSASAAYAIGNKAIQESELADLRSWYGIFNQVKLIPLNLKPGEYVLKYKDKNYKLTRSNSPKQILPLILN